MANLKEIRGRIASVSSTMQITSAMKMVSAAKLKKAQDAITVMRPYADTLTQLVQNLNQSLEGDDQNPFTIVRPTDKVLIVAITSNRGLCGGFNSNVIKQVRYLLKKTYAGKQVKIIAIGKKGQDVLSKAGNVMASHNTLFDNLNYTTAGEVAQQIMNSFVAADFDKAVLVYNQSKNAATQVVQTEPYLPIVPVSSDDDAQPNADYIFEPSREAIVNELLPKLLKVQLFKAIRNSIASEHGARMTAMHKATDNATELRDRLKLTYNKARQAAITSEILEIVAGAEALKG